MPKKPKRLYKSFRIGEDGVTLRSPYVGNQAWSPTKKALTLKNYEGWTSKKIKGEIRMCWSGFHAGTLQGWHGVRSFAEFKRARPSMALFEVELHQTPNLTYAKDWYCQGDFGKWVGRSFTIIKRVA